MDNRIFNVNGELNKKDFLRAAISLAFQQQYSVKAKSFIECELGLILLSYAPEKDPAVKSLVSPVDEHGAFTIVDQWLQHIHSDPNELKKFKLEGWDQDSDHDGDNYPGWRIFVEGWGHVAGYHGAILCVTPAFMWHGK